MGVHDNGFAPDAFAFEVAEGKLRSTLVLKCAHNGKVSAKPVSQRLIPWNAFGNSLTAGDEVQNGEQQTWLVRSFMPAGTVADDIHVEVIERLHGLIEIRNAWSLRHWHHADFDLSE